jgi:hypothetical protein
VIPRRFLLPALLLLALTVRVWGLGFGLPHIIARPDETEVAGPAVGFLSGDLRPPFFQWPTLFVYAVALLYLVYFFVTRPFGGYATLAAFAESRRQSVAPFIYMSRALSAAMGVMTVWWVYRICRRWFDETVALVASLFLALSFLHVRDSHFGTVDVTMTALVVLAVLAILQWRDTGRLRHAAAAGVAGGLAASTKYNGLGVWAPFCVALTERFVEDLRARSWSYATGRKVQAFVVFGLALALGFFGASPYILIDWHRFVADVSGVESHVSGGHGIVLGRGWWYYARVVLPAAVGWPIFVAGTVGTIGLLTRRFRDAAVVFAFPISYYLAAGRGYTVFARYIIPILPFLCIAASWLVVETARALTRERAPAVRDAVLAAAAVALVAPTAYKTLLLDRLLGTADNRVVVARALGGMAAPTSFLYQSGERYGYVPLRIDGHDVARSSRYDETAGRFDTGDPDWILVQRSPLVLYSAVPSSLDRVLTERYALVRRFPSGDDRSGRVYDQQDAFYLPLEGLGGLGRPGPSFELYEKK